MIWSHDPVEHRLSRRIWPVLSPDNDDLRGPAVAMLDGVESFDIRVLSDAGADWSPEHGTDPAGDPARLPRAVELRLGTEVHGALRLLVAF